MKQIVVLLLLVSPIVVKAQGANQSPRENIACGGGVERYADTKYIIDGNPVYPLSQMRPRPICELKGWETPGDYVLNRDEIINMPYSDINDMLSIFPGSYQLQRGAALNIYGARANATLYSIDDIQLLR